MVSDILEQFIADDLKTRRESGLYMEERIVHSPQGAWIQVDSGEVLSLCTNNYLGLANHPFIKAAAACGLEMWGFGTAAGRSLTGTLEIHKRLEEEISRFIGTEDAMLYSSCFDANGGLFEALLSEEDAIISDQLNHASIIDGIRLCKAEKRIYSHSDMEELEEHLNSTRNRRFRLIATDGVFSMDSDFARLNEICDLADKYRALVMVDDAHATGFVGPKGRGTLEYRGVMGRVDIVTSTLGKAMGGASGGFTAGRRSTIEYLRQHSRPYIFSNSLSPSVAAASRACLELLENADSLRARLINNTRYFRRRISEAGFEIRGGDHPIVPVMIGDAKAARAMAGDLLLEKVFVIAMGFPIVAKGQARIRVIISALHEQKDLDFAVAKFTKVATEHGIL